MAERAITDAARTDAMLLSRRNLSGAQARPMLSGRCLGQDTKSYVDLLITYYLTREPTIEHDGR